LFVIFFFRLFVGWTLFVLYMQEWYRDLVTLRLVRNTTLAHIPPPEINPIMANHVLLQDKFYPFRSSLPYCIILPEANGNNFELKPQFINILPRFHGLKSEDGYFFIRSLKKYAWWWEFPNWGKMLLDWDLSPLHLRTWPWSGCTTCLLVLIHHGMTLLRCFLKNSTPSIRLPSSGRTLCSIDRKPMNHSESILKCLRIC